MTNIRNCALIAHIDHGKSTLADRIIESCGAVGTNHQPQLLDSLELEREHGITIKLKAIRLKYRLDASDYTLNLIDTPGHVDFSYEVSRSLSCVEGAILIVDATSGVQAQTLANYNLAKQSNLTIIPVVNKIDQPAAEIEKTIYEIKSLGFEEEEILKVSAKTGQNVDKLIKQVIDKIPAPKSLPEISSSPSDQLTGLIFDSSIDPYKGVIASVRIFSAEVKVGDEILFVASDTKSTILQLGYLTPKPHFVEKLSFGEIGFIITNLKELSKVAVGDTVTLFNNPAVSLPGYKPASPVVYLSIYPTQAVDFPKLATGLEKLKLNDAALEINKESSTSLGFGFRIGFLGLLHAQITQERLEREFGLDIIAVAPSVNFKINDKLVNKPSDFDPLAKNVFEPYAKLTIFTPEKYIGPISNLINKKRGQIGQVENIASLLKINVEIPLLDIMSGFYDQIKGASSGYASFDFELLDFRPADLVKLEILVNQMPIEQLSQIVPKNTAENAGRKIVENLKDIIPKQQIPIPIQAAIGGKIIARETISAYRKDVTAKLYGGDITRKMKLLEKQKKGKKRMKRFGKVDIPQDAFLAVLKI